MQLTPAQQTIYNQWMSEHGTLGRGIQCPACNRTDFSQPRIVKFPELPVMIVQTCTNCKYVRFMDAKGIGID